MMIKSKMRLWYEQPAEEWVEALPIGNGELGAMVFGGIATERIQFNNDTLFAGEPHDYSHKGAVKHLPKIRELLFDGKQEDAHELAEQEFMSISTRGTNKQEAYQPFGDIVLSFPGHEDATEYYRELDLDNAIVTTKYSVDAVNYSRRIFASYPDQAIVMKIEADTRGSINLNATLASPHEGVVTKVENETIVMSGKVQDGKTRFEARLALSVENGTLATEDGNISVVAADCVTMTLVGASSFINYGDISGDPAKTCKQRLATIDNATFEELNKRHVADYRNLFERCTLDLGTSETADQPTSSRLKSFGPEDPQLVALFFQYGRYLMISCSRPGSQPANLQGVWNEKLRPQWDSKYTININTEMNYWIAELTGLSECHEPLFDAIKDLAVTGKKVAEDHYGAPGWVVHHNFDLWRGAAPINNSKHGIWATGGAWLCQHLWWRYIFNGNIAFLKDDAYPLLKGASLFFLDYLVKDPKGKEGYLVSGPSNSPERGALVMGPTMDHQIIRTLLRNTAAAAKVLDVDDELQRTMLDTADKIVPNQIGSQGQLKEWFYMEDPETEHRHVPHLWGLHPGLEIHPRKTKELADACRVTLKFRGDGGTGWSKAWKINFWSRLLDGDHAYKMLTEALRLNTYPNLFDAHPPFQIDGNFGATSGIAEMLMQSDGSEIELLPALPTAFASGKITGLRARGGFIVDIEWQDGKLVKAKITSFSGNDVNIRYGNEISKLELSKGNSRIIN